MLLHVGLASSSDLPVPARVGRGQALLELDGAGLRQPGGDPCASPLVVGCQALACTGKGANLEARGAVLEVTG